MSSAPSTSPAAQVAAAPAGSRTGHYLALDLARGFAALAVMVYHLGELLGRREVMPGAYLSVDLFFLMSGFVVANSYETRLRSGAMSFWRFARVRIVRLYPLYIASVAIGAAYFLGKIALHQPTALPLPTLLAATPPALLVLPATVKDFSGFGFSPAAWSLSLEIWFNFVYALTAARFGSRTLGALALVSFAVLVQQALQLHTVDLGWGISTLLGGVARFWFSFTAGLLLWRAMQAGKWKLPDAAARLVQAGWPLVFVAGFLFILIPRENVGLQLAFVAVGFPLFVYLSAHIRTDGFMTRVSDHAGRLSYGLYILHTPVMLLALGLATSMLGRGWREDIPLAFATLAAAIVIATCLLTYVFDEPVRRFLRARLEGPRRKAMPAAAS